LRYGLASCAELFPGWLRHRVIRFSFLEDAPMSKRFVFPFLLAFSLFPAGCNLPLQNFGRTMTAPPTLAVETLQPYITAVTLTPSANTPASLEASPLPSASATPMPGPTATAYAPFSISPFTDNVKLRTNPGYLFPASILVHSNTTLLVYGRSAGNEWIYVEAPGAYHGWVFAKLLNEDERMLQAPLVEPGEVQILRGRITDQAGRPVSGVQFAITQGGGSNPLRNDAVTDANGEFTAFMPLDSSGTWTVAYEAINCDSNQMDESCNCLRGICGKPEPASVQISLPYNETLLFAWK
jgi:hypothetical protein